MEATKAPNNSISGFPRFWNEEISRPTTSRRSLSLSRQRQFSRHKRPAWFAPDVNIRPVLGQYAEQKNPGLATDADMQAVEAKLSEPTVVHPTVIHLTPVRSPESATSETFQRDARATDGSTDPTSPVYQAQEQVADDWRRRVKRDPDAPPDYSDTTHVRDVAETPVGFAELPGHSTTEWRVIQRDYRNLFPDYSSTEKPAKEDDYRNPFPDIQPDNHPSWTNPELRSGYSGRGYGPRLQIPSEPQDPNSSPLRGTPSHSSSRTRFSLSGSSNRSSLTKSHTVRVPEHTAPPASGSNTGRPRASSSRRSTGNVKESNDLYGAD